jgi:tetratricopeptide (TPR) repeat protein
MDIIPEVGFYVSLAEMYKEQGREEEMKTLLDEVFVMLQDDVDSGHNMNLEYAHIYLDILNDVEKAEQFIQKEYEKRPNNIDVNLMMAKVSKRKGDKISQDKYLAIAQKTNSKKPELLKMVNG